MHDKAQSSEIFWSFQAKTLRAVICLSFETAYLSFQDRELSKNNRFVELGLRKVVVHTFLGGPKPLCSDSLGARNIESYNCFVLGPTLVKLHIRIRLIDSFSTTFRAWWWAEEKLHLTPVHTLCRLKRDEALFPPVLNKRWPCTLVSQSFCTFEISSSSVLRPILLKLHILTRLTESFPMVHGLWSCIEIEMSIRLGAHA